MTILAVETATSLQSVALVGTNGLLAAETACQSLSPGSTRRPDRWSIMPAIDRMLRACHIVLRDVDVLAVSIGPGSFTGLRVGLATMKGLAYGADKPLVAVPTLHALAYNVFGLGLPVCTVLDAKRGELFLAVFHARYNSGAHSPLSYMVEPQRLRADTVAHVLSSHLDDRVVIVGDGVALCRSMLSEQLRRRTIFPADIASMPSAISVAYLGKDRFTHGMLAGDGLKPLYLRPPDATPNLPGHAAKSSHLPREPRHDD